MSELHCHCREDIGYRCPLHAIDWQARAETAEAREAKLREALTRQGDNMAFALNNMPLPAQWYDKFSRELAEDRAALGGEHEHR